MNDGVEDDEPAPDTSPWMICPECHGEGKSSAYLGSFTQEDIERDWSPDDWEDYCAGAYDRPCDVCGGSGKIREKAYDAFCERRDEVRSESHHHYERGY